MTPTSVLRVTTTVQKGGAGAHVLAIHNAVTLYSDIESHLLCPRDDLVVHNAIPYKYGASAAKLNFLKTKILGLDSYFEPMWMHRFKKRVPQFDIVHLHHLQGYFFDLRSLALLRNKNVVLTLHDVWPLTGRCSVLTGCDRWKRSCSNCPRRDVYPSTFIDLSHFLHEKKKQLFGSLDRLKIVVLSRYAESLLKQSYLLDKECVIIPPGIDCSIFKPHYRAASELPVLGVMAAKAGDELKGFDVVQELIKFLAREERPRFYLHLVGGLDKKTRRQLSEYSFVRHTPFVSEATKLAQLYNSFDLFLNFSRQETFGKTIIEAQSCGVPVVARRIPAFEENVEYGELVEDVRPSELLSVIESVLSHRWDALEMHRSMQKFSLKNLAHQYVALYKTFENKY